MRIKAGRSISLIDELNDVIAESLPRTAEMDTFCASKEFDQILDDIASLVENHLTANIEEFTKEILK